MKAIVYNQAGPITAPDALIEFETETPELGPRDLLVEVRGISVNPVDVKVRADMAPDKGLTWPEKSSFSKYILSTKENVLTLQSQ